MTKEAWQQCPPAGTGNDKRITRGRHENAKVTLQDFIDGGEMENGFNLKCLQLPENEVWEIRVVRHPQVRLFGWFFQYDGFLVTHLASRNALSVGKKGTDTFEQAIAKVQRLRETTFYDVPCHCGGCLSDYVSNGVEGFDDDAV